MSMIAAGILLAASATVGTASALEQRDEAKDNKKEMEQIAAAENKNAKYASALEKKRTASARQYEPGYALMASEVEKPSNLAEQAIPMTGSLIAADDLRAQRAVPGADQTGTAPGGARKQAIDLSGSSVTAGQIAAGQQDLKTALDLENFQKKKAAIDTGKAYVGS